MNRYFACRAARSRDYCQDETVDFQCPSDEFIVVERALFGIMRLGRCVRADYGHTGCAADVTSLLAGKCSGRRRCRVANIEALLARSRACPAALTGYLETSMVCVPGKWGLVCVPGKWGMGCVPGKWGMGCVPGKWGMVCVPAKLSMVCVPGKLSMGCEPGK